MIKYCKSSVKHLWTSKDSLITVQSLWYFHKWILFLREWCHVLHAFSMVFLHSLCISAYPMVTSADECSFLQAGVMSYGFGYSVLSSTLLTAETWTGQVYPSFSMIGKTLISSKKDQKMSDIIFSRLNDFIVKIWKNMTSSEHFTWLVASVSNNEVASFLLIIIEIYFALVENVINFISYLKDHQCL